MDRSHLPRKGRLRIGGIAVAAISLVAFLARSGVASERFIPPGFSHAVTDALKNGGVWLKHEIEYILARGYTIGQGGRSLMPPAK